METPIQMRLMRIEDLDEVMEIEHLCFSIPWSRESFAREVLDNRCARYLVLLKYGRVVAYAGTWFVLDEGHITNIAVHPAYRGQKYGEAITNALIQLAADSGIRFMTLEVRRTNTVAQSLYHKLGFVDVGYRKRYYTDNNEDALIMALESMPEAHPEADPYLIHES